MFEFSEGLPPDVLAFEAIGKVTDENYRTIVIPKAGAFGITLWHEFKRIALVTDQAWMRPSINMFASFFPAEVRLSIQVHPTVVAQAQL